MKKGFFLQWVTCLLAVSCSIHELDLNEVSSGDVMFYASLESYSEPDTRVYVDQKVKMLWDAKDQISIFNKSSLNQQFEFTGETGDNAGGFNEIMTPPGTGTDLSFICAVYPYRSSTRIDKEGVMTLTLPEEQAYKDGSFGVGVNTMVSSTDAEDNMLKFKNVGGYLVLKFYGEGVSVSSIKLEGNNQERLSGDATLTPAVGKVPMISMSPTAKTSVTLNCENPVDLSATKEGASQFWMVVPPTDFLQGFTLTVKDPYGREFVQKTSAKLSVQRNGVLRIAPIEVVFDTDYPIYNKVSSITAGGTYLIVDVSETRVLKGATDGLFESISPWNNIIMDTGGSLANYEFAIEKEGDDYFLRFNDGKYLVCDYGVNSSTGLRYVDAQSDVTYPYVLTTGNDGAFFFSTTHVLNGNVNTNQVLYYKSDSNNFKIGGSGKSIGVHLYLKDGKLDRGLGFDPKSVTCTLGDTPEKPVLSGIYETVTYSSSDDLIATVDANGNVTTVAPGTVTITATVPEDNEYIAGSASYTLHIRKAATGGWMDLETFNLENKALYDYLNDANGSYSNTNDDTFTVMDKYVSGTYLSIDRKDCPAPVVIEWSNSASRSTVISIYGDDSLTGPVWTQNATEGATSAEVYNLIPGRTYYYTLSENSIIWEKGYFSTSGRRRMIKVSDVEAKGHANNCRDLGGLAVSDHGKETTIKYGYLFRGSNMDKTTDSEKSILLDFLKIGMDVDLRSGSSDAGWGENGSEYCYQPFKEPNYSVGYVNPGFNSFDDLKTVGKVKAVLTAIFETAESGKATYFHCYVGADRTGYIAMLIEGLLGVSEKDCSIDYELTSFSDAVGLRYRTGKPKDYYFRQGIQFLRSQPGDSFQDKIEYYLVNTVQIDMNAIETFKGIVLEPINNK